MSPEEYRRAGAEELVAAGGETRMPPARQQWLAPVGLRAADDAIEWLPHESHERGGVIVPTEGLLEEFVTLADADAARVLAFAQRHGVLGPQPPKWYSRGEYAREPLVEWHAAARRAAALVGAAAKLRQGQLLTDDERVPVLHAAWPDVEPPLFTPRQLFLDGDLFNEPYPNREAALRDALLEYANRTLESDRTDLTWAVSRWMDDAGARLVLTWPAGSATPELTIGGERPRGCLAAITVQVALACARAEPVQTCAGCGTLHAPQRKPKPRQRSFCQACRDAGVPVKLANRDRRAKLRASRKQG